MTADRAGSDRDVTDLVDAVVPVAIVERSGVVESVHHAVAVAVGTDGEPVECIGRPDVAVYPRSSNKPMQADAMVRLGLDVDDAELAVACASHDGTDRHVAVVRRILARAGLDESALGNTPAMPLRTDAMRRIVAAGGDDAAILMNCSGKHAAMAATCVAQGWPVDGYLERDHPLQEAITGHIDDLAGPVHHVGVDGCGAPAHVVTVRRLAEGFRTLAVQQGAVWRAMTAHPDLVGGEDRTVTRVMRALPSAMAKDGAEGVFAVAHPDGWAVALKIADGSERAVAAVLGRVLAAIGIDLDVGSIGPPVLGHGRPVGSIRTLES